MHLNEIVWWASARKAISATDLLWQNVSLRWSAFVLVALLLPLFSPISSVAQEAVRIEVRKAVAGSGAQTTVDLYLLMDLAGVNFDNPLDTVLTRLDRFEDDTGRDLLALHRERQRQNMERGFPSPDPVEFRGVGDWANDRDVRLGVTVVDSPAPGATRLVMAGEVVFNFAADGEPATSLVENVSLETVFSGRQFDTDIGTLLIQDAGSASVDGSTWHKFRISSAETAIVGASVIGGDDSGEVPFWAVDRNEFVFGEVPEAVSISIQYLQHRKVAVPLNLEITLGL
jgi:hypothetical protein